MEPDQSTLADIAASHHAVALIGMMGAGKSTIGRMLATRLARPFLDSDAVIEERTGMSVAEIFRQHGEGAFREWEAQVVREAVESTEPIVTGVAGGAILREETQKCLATNATVVWLNAPIETLIGRVVQRRLDRPMISEDPDKAMRRLYEVREPLYRKLANKVVSVEGKTPTQITDQLIEALK